jgi:hypothetical protein
MGRPSVLEDPITTPRVEEFLRLVADGGMSAAGACRVAGISQSTLYGWIERADDADAAPCFSEFSERFARARGARESRLVRSITGARIRTRGGNKADWRAAAWLLERLEPESYGRHAKVGPGTPNTVKLLVVEGGLPEQG